MKKIIVFGAAFDPPHLGHQLMIKTVLESKLADGVWLLPAKRHPFSKSMAPTEHRLGMLQSLITDSRIRIEDFELNQEGVGYTHQTLQALRYQYPETSLSFLIGSDNLARFEEWDQYQAMLQEFSFYIYPRTGYPMQPLLPGMIALADVQQVEISSTQIRELIRKNQPFSHLLPQGVFEYIAKNRLYLDNA